MLSGVTGSLAAIRRQIRSLGNPARAEVSQRYFKTGAGEYGEGDRFIGVDAPAMHSLSKQYRDLPLPQVEQLLHSQWHEERAVALLILVRKVEAKKQSAAPDDAATIPALYLANTSYINNWDLVDSSAAQIVGAHGDLKLLQKLARSQALWERRIAIIATLHSIREGNFEPTLTIAKLLLNDAHDLIHKATGWMLREVGKRDPAAEKRFLDEYAPTMPRTMLRYAIERLPDSQKRKYLAR
jgi:3-methyladenine DNA glycosylase AlkD